MHAPCVESSSDYSGARTLHTYCDPRINVCMDQIGLNMHGKQSQT